MLLAASGKMVCLLCKWPEHTARSEITATTMSRILLQSIEFNDGTKLDLTPKSKAAMSDYTAFMITDMLKTL